MSELKGKIALVTGASRGIGRASAKAIAENGGHVIVHYVRGAAEANSLVAEIRGNGGRADAVAADMEKPEGAHELASQVRAIVGQRLDILVLNAGVSKSVTFEETTVEDFDRLFAVNVRSPFFVLQKLLPVLGEGSSVIFISSVVARTAVENLAAYSATKGALSTMVRHFASLLGPKGIRVNAVAPGVVDTDMSSFSRSEAGRNYTLAMQAIKRIAKPEDISAVVAFLASDASRWITGDSIAVDGGSKL